MIDFTIHGSSAPDFTVQVCEANLPIDEAKKVQSTIDKVLTLLNQDGYYPSQQVVADFLITETIPDRMKLFTQSIDTLNMTIRTTNGLKAAGLLYIGDVCKRTEVELLKIPNLGRKSINELIEVLNSRDLKLGLYLPDWQKFRPRD